jgi:hypothetical protein
MQSIPYAAKSILACGSIVLHEMKERHSDAVMARDGSTACVVVGGVLFTAAVMLALVRHPPLTRGGGNAPARVQRPATAAGQAPSSDPLDVALDRQAPLPPVVAPEATPAAGQKCEYGEAQHHLHLRTRAKSCVCKMCTQLWHYPSSSINPAMQCPEHVIVA